MDRSSWNVLFQISTFHNPQCSHNSWYLNQNNLLGSRNQYTSFPHFQNTRTRMNCDKLKVLYAMNLTFTSLKSCVKEVVQFAYIRKNTRMQQMYKNKGVSKVWHRVNYT